MEKELKKEDIQKVAATYLMKHIDQAPEGVVKFVEKLQKYDQSISILNKNIAQCQDTMSALQAKGSEIYGSILSMVELISEGLTPEQIDEFCVKYIEEIDSGNKTVVGATGKKIVADDEPDIAGSTAR